MKAKYYKIRELLSGFEAMEYLRLLTSVSLDELEFTGLVIDGVPNYVPIPHNVVTINGELVSPIGLQQIKKARLDDYQWDKENRGLDFMPYKVKGGGLEARDGIIELFGVPEEGGQPRDWALTAEAYAQGGFPFEFTPVFFNPRDIESLAAKMNDEPDYQVLQEENQHLRQEIEALKAEVERLQAENAQLKAGARVSGEINPREKETLYRLIIGMAQAGYLYDPNALKNSAVADIHKDLDRLGIGLGERTIRSHLNAAKDYLPPKPIKP